MALLTHLMPLLLLSFMHRPNEVLKAALVVQHCIEEASTLHQKVPWKMETSVVILMIHTFLM